MIGIEQTARGHTAARFILGLAVAAGCGRLGFAPDDVAPDAAVDGGLDCPSLEGPVMARATGGCIDTTEVTKAQYARFLEAREPVRTDGACSFNTTYAPPAYIWNATTSPDQPVSGIDWCDARDYCEWAGKRLCGAIGGGGLGHDEHATPASQWYMACSQGLGLRHPYGTILDDTVKPGYCHLDGTDNSVGQQADVGSHPECVLPDAAVYDLLGNVQEWIDACEPAGSSPEASACRVMGGVWYFASSYSTCNFADPVAGMGAARSMASHAIGFRCCAD